MKTSLELIEEAHSKTIFEIESKIRGEMQYEGNNIHVGSLKITDRVKEELKRSGFKIEILNEDYYKISW